MTTYEVPDRRNDPDPNRIIDPSRVHDSTAGLQTFIAGCPNDATIVLPFGVTVNGTVTVGAGQTLQSADFGRPARIVRTTTYPWRVVPDRRPTVGGLANPAYNPDGVAARWQYDCLGGQDAEPMSLRNPHGLHPDGTPYAHGSEWGGYDGTTGRAGLDFDHEHISTFYDAPFDASHVGRVIQGLICSGSMGKFARPIVEVSDDCRTAYFTDDGTVLHQDSSGTLAWCVTFAGAGWCAMFMPNPSWKPRYDDGGSNRPWNGFMNALNLAIRFNQQPIIRCAPGAHLLGVELVGPNQGWRLCIPNFEKSDPMVNEFQHGVVTSSPESLVACCHIHHTWGNAEYGAGAVAYNRLEDCGRQATIAHFDHKRISANVIQRTRHSAIDVEAPHAHADVEITHNIFGGPHGVAISSPLNRFVYAHNRSTFADVENGTVDAVAPPQAVPWGGGGSDWSLEANQFDDDAGSRAAFSVKNVTRLSVVRNRRATRGWFVEASGSTDVDVHDNDGGIDCRGQVAE